MPIVSTNKPPYEVYLDFIENEWYKYVKYSEPIGFFQAGGMLLPSGEIPSIFSVPIECDIEQLGHGENKGTLDVFEFHVKVYTYNADLLFNYKQILSKILIFNNKLKNTTQFSDSGIEWTNVTNFTYIPYLISNEHIYYEILCTVQCAYQDSYHL